MASFSVELQQYLKHWIHVEQKTLHPGANLATFLDPDHGHRKLGDLCKLFGLEVEGQLSVFTNSGNEKHLIGVLKLCCALIREIAHPKAGIFSDSNAAVEVTAKSMRFIFEHYWKYEPKYRGAEDDFEFAVAGWLRQPATAALAANHKPVKEQVKQDDVGVGLIRKYWILPRP